MVAIEMATEYTVVQVLENVFLKSGPACNPNGAINGLKNKPSTNGKHRGLIAK